MVYKWIQKAGMKKGVFSKQLGIPEEKIIPMTLLKKITKAKTGDTIKNPTKLGKRQIKVTTLLKKRANMVINLKKISSKQ